MGHDLNLCIRNLVLKQTYSLISTYLFNKLPGGEKNSKGIIVSRVLFQLDDVKITLLIFAQKV